MGATKWVENSSGYLELIDCETKVVIAREKRRTPPRKRRAERRPGRPSKAELAEVSRNPAEPQRALYDPVTIAENVSAALMSGIRFESLGPQHGCPSQPVIARLRRENPEFSENIQAARETQALMRLDLLEERLMALVEDARRRGDRSADQLACEVFKFLAEVNDPSRYTAKRKRGRPKKSPFGDVLSSLGFSGRAIISIL